MTQTTLCWNCSHSFDITKERCPECNAANANVLTAKATSEALLVGMTVKPLPPPFKREQRYIVFKVKDLVKLDPYWQKQLTGLRIEVELLRHERGKPDLDCVVIEKDWPEYEPVWKMVEDRMTGKKPLTFEQWAESVGLVDGAPGYGIAYTAWKASKEQT